MYTKPMISVEDAKNVIDSAQKATNYADLNNTSFLGVMGSSLKEDYIGDIDIVLFPKENSYEGVKDLFNYHIVLNEIVKKDHGLELSPFPLKAMQDDVTYIISRNNDNVLPVHVLYFKDMNDFDCIIPEEYKDDAKTRFKNNTFSLKGSVLDILEHNNISSYEQNLLIK